MYLTDAARERGQAIILFVGIFSVILVMAAIVVDFGLWFAERRSAQRGADLAAAAAAQDLPLSPDLAFTSACLWAIENGFDYREDDVKVDVEVFARGTPEPPVSCLAEPAPTPACGSDCDTVRVTVSKGAPQLFTALEVFGIGEFKVGAVAAAGLTYAGAAGSSGTPDQTIILMDAQGRMGDGCGSNPTGCPIAKAREGALGLVNLLMPSESTNLVGYAPYHNCYGPAHPLGPPVGCVADQTPGNLVVPLATSDQVASITTAIQATTSYSYPANICVPLQMVQEEGLFLSPQPGARQVIVLLSDGDNLDHAMAEQVEQPPDECHPASHLQFGFAGNCDASRPAESQLDLLTWQMAQELKAQGIEIFVIGTRMCGGEDGQVRSDAYCNAATIGQYPSHDNQQDQRLLKCIASSPDHYQRVNDVADLPEAFRNIAVELATRSLLQ